jgi:hypothetical protein
METGKNTSSKEQKARQTLADLHVCLAKIVGKYAAYPEVDAAVFRRLHSSMEEGLRRGAGGPKLGDYCQEMRAVLSCPAAELLQFADADETDLRLAAIAQVVRQRARLAEGAFRELLTGLLSWERVDKSAILEAVTAIVRS